MKIYIQRSEVTKQYWFTIIAKNGEIVAQSETYHNKKDCKDTAKLIISQAQNAVIIDVKK